MGIIEIEVKAQTSNEEELKKKIQDLGAVFKIKKYQHDILLDPPTTDFSKTDQVLRIRNSDGNWKLDYKSPRLDNETKSRREFSLKIDDGKQLKDIFTFMNFTTVGEIEKTRESYTLNKMTINFDTVTNLGNFLEIEVLEEEQHFEQTKKDIFTFLEQLGIKDTIKKDYLELLWDKGYFKKN